MALNTLLLLAMAISYMPQINNIAARRSTSGVAQMYVMFTYIFTASQFALVMIYSSWGRPIVSCIVDRELKGIDAYGAILGLLQMTLLWIGSSLLLLFFFLYPNQRYIRNTNQAADLIADSPVMIDRGRYPKVVLSICVMHTCIWVFPAMVLFVTRPNMDEPFTPAGFFICFIDYLLIPGCFLMVTSIFPLQIWELLSSESLSESSLSPITLAVQTVAFILLSLSWKSYVGKPGDPYNIMPPGLTHRPSIYRLGAWQWVNNMILGTGQGFLLLIYIWVRRQERVRGHAHIVDETSALL